MYTLVMFFVLLPFFIVLIELVRILGRMFILSVLVFFFFQAEDGIRDTSVTGVQTCALPISYFNVRSVGRESCPDHVRVVGRPLRAWLVRRQHVPRISRYDPPTTRSVELTRSEERRVGKECRSRWSPKNENEKKNIERALRS